MRWLSRILPGSVRSRLDAIEQLLHTIIERLSIMPTQADLDAAIAALNDATNAEAAKVAAVAADVAAVSQEIAALQAQLTAAPTVTQATLDALSAATAKLQGSASSLGSVDSSLKSLAAPTPPPAS